MSSHREKMAEFRRQKKQEGYVEANIWLSPDDRAALEAKSKATGLNRSDLIRLALRKITTEEATM